MSRCDAEETIKKEAEYDHHQTPNHERDPFQVNQNAILYSHTARIATARGTRALEQRVLPLCSELTGKHRLRPGTRL
jgi:fatty-acid desaturase